MIRRSSCRIHPFVRLTLVVDGFLNPSCSLSSLDRTYRFWNIVCLFKNGLMILVGNFSLSSLYRCTQRNLASTSTADMCGFCMYEFATRICITFSLLLIYPSLLRPIWILSPSLCISLSFGLFVCRIFCICLPVVVWWWWKSFEGTYVQTVQILTWQSVYVCARFDQMKCEPSESVYVFVNTNFFWKKYFPD